MIKLLSREAERSMFGLLRISIHLLVLDPAISYFSMEVAKLVTQPE